MGETLPDFDAGIINDEEFKEVPVDSIDLLLLQQEEELFLMPLLEIEGEEEQDEREEWTASPTKEEGGILCIQQDSEEDRDAVEIPSEEEVEDVVEIVPSSSFSFFKDSNSFLFVLLSQSSYVFVVHLALYSQTVIVRIQEA